MSRSWTPEGFDRGQAEPIASLVAIAVLALALGLYGMYLTDALPGTSERSVEGPTLDRTWHAIGANGTFQADRYVGGNRYEVGSDPTIELEDSVESRYLPQGRNVYVAVTVIDDDGDKVVVAEEQYAADGSYDGPINRPDDVDTKSRSIPVRLEPGTVTGGKLVVEVWG